MNKLKFLLIVSFISLIAIPTALASTAPIVYVATDGSGDYNCDGTNDHIEINQALNFVRTNSDFTTVYLKGPNTYWIDDTLLIGGDTTLTGDSDARIKLVNNAGWGQDRGMIEEYDSSSDDITIHGFEMDGNHNNQGVALGRHYYNMIQLADVSRVDIHDMYLHDNSHDVIQLSGSYTFADTDHKVYDNTIIRPGHEGVMLKKLKGTEVYNNIIGTRCNSGIRTYNSKDFSFHDNYIYRESGGFAGIQIQKSGDHTLIGGDIYSNTIHGVAGPGIAIEAKGTYDADEASGLHIYNNIIYDTGEISSHANAGILIHGYSTVIENNVIDGCYGDGIVLDDVFDADPTITGTSYTILRNNIVTNTNKDGTVKGNGIADYISGHEFILESNDVWNSAGSNYEGVSAGDNDLQVNPLFVDPMDHDYRLKSDSPLIGTGIGLYESADSTPPEPTTPEPSNTAPVLSSIGDMTVTEGSALSFVTTASDADGDSLTYSASGLPNGATFDGASRTFSWTPDIGQEGTYGVTFEVTDGELTDSETVSITVNADSSSGNTLESMYVNRLRESTPDTVITADSYMDIGNIAGTGSYRDVMWFDLSDYEETDTITSATLSLSWYYPQNAPRNQDTVVEIYRAADWDPAEVSWNEKASGTPWNNAGGDWFDSNGVSQGSTPYASITFSGSDVPDNGNYEFDVTELVRDYVSGEHANTGFIVKARNEYDNYIAFYGSDFVSTNQQPKLTVTLSTTEPVGNLAPVMGSIGNMAVDEGSTLNFVLSASDADGDSLTYSANALPEGATFDAASGAFSWTPSDVQAGTYSITFEVTDGQLTDSEAVIVTVNEGFSPTTPSETTSYVDGIDNRLRESTPDLTLTGDGYVDVGNIAGTGSYRDVMWFDLSDYEETDTITSATLSLSWYYPQNAPRNQDTVVEIYRAADWDPAEVSWNEKASGTPWNNAGGDWFDSNGVPQGSTPYASITFSGSDVPDNGNYEFDVTELVQDYVSGEHANTGFFIKARNEYDNYIAFYGTDFVSTNQQPKLTVTLSTTEPVGNLAPVMGSIGNMAVDEGSTLNFVLSASDADGDSLTYSVTGLPEGATFDATSGAFSWTPSDVQAGTYSITFEVTDGQLTDSEAVIVTVNEGFSPTTPSETTSYVDGIDNRLRESTPDLTLTGDGYVDVGNIAGTGSYRNVMWFDLSDYEETDTITSATLSLSWYYPQNAPRNQDTVVEIYRAADWDPAEVSWNEKASGTPWNNAGGDWFDSNGVPQGSTPYASITFSGSDVPGNGNYEFDVTELVQDYVSGEHANTGFFIKARNEYDNYIAFYGTDFVSTNQQPKLTISHASATEP